MQENVAALVRRFVNGDNLAELQAAAEVLIATTPRAPDLARDRVCLELLRCLCHMSVAGVDPEEIISDLTFGGALAQMMKNLDMSSVLQWYELVAMLAATPSVYSNDYTELLEAIGQAEAWTVNYEEWLRTDAALLFQGLLTSLKTEVLYRQGDDTQTRAMAEQALRELTPFLGSGFPWADARLQICHEVWRGCTLQALTFATIIELGREDFARFLPEQQ